MKIVTCVLTNGWILFFNLCFSQSYVKIPIDSNYYWRQLSCGYHYLIHYEKDTLVSGTIYNKYSQFGPSKGNLPCPSSFIKYGYLRQDTLAKKVFILDNNFHEQPLYNFSKSNVGDTMLMYNKSLNAVITVTIAAVSSNSQSQMTGQVIDGPDYSNILIPGIGSIIGGLFGHGQKLNGELTEKLVCFARQNPFVFITQGSYSHGSYDSCDFPTGLNSSFSSESSGVHLFPNPVQEKLAIELNTYSGETSMSLYNSLGQILLVQNTVLGEQYLDVSSLSCGVYYLKIQSQQESQIFKILKQ